MAGETQPTYLLLYLLTSHSHGNKEKHYELERKCSFSVAVGQEAADD